NSKDNVVILTDETGTNFRPDSVCYNEDGGYRIIHDNKDLSGKNPYLYDTPQLRAERNAARTDGGEHIITVTSNKSFVNGNPMVKISAPAAEYSTIYYVDKESKVITHIWQDGKWIKIK
ncbi:hypothetical protein, partial [Clostridium butyricum]|nr:hypothetical protein [Clostridium butyricum]